MNYAKTLAILFICCLFSAACSKKDLISLFPMEHYDQTISTWLKPSDPGYDKALLSTDMQQQRFAIFYDHYFGQHSPWNSEHVTKILAKRAPDDLKSVEQELIHAFDNRDKTEKELGYGENFRPHSEQWIDLIADNINLTQLDHLSYQASNRGIAVDNLYARSLPTSDVSFYSHKLAGQGYPFDNLQISALWAGTPVYILATTKDHSWSLVLTPDYIAWVETKGIARTDNFFVDLWLSAAKKKLFAITHTQTGLVDETGHFLLSAYVGTVFPASATPNEMMVPVADEHGHAVIKNAAATSDYAVAMPLSVTPHNIAAIMSTLIGRPYGWGNLYFYNDCSAELKNLFTPFGIWLPRHSADQVKVGNRVDMTSYPAAERLAYLMENGQPLLTIVYIGGHVILYVGNYPNPNDHAHPLMAMTYQNAWGLSPHPPTRRAVIGKAVLMPLLLQYPEDKSLASWADKKYFQVAFLAQLPNTDAFAQQLEIDLRNLMGTDDK